MQRASGAALASSEADEKPRYRHLTQISVIVPTYRRPLPLAKCVAALSRQSRPPDEVLVVIRAGDDEAVRICTAQRDIAISIVRIERPGVAAAYNAGLAAAAGDIVAFTDDDAEPDPNWIAALLARYQQHPLVAGVGGRDVLGSSQPRPGRAPLVGRMQWFGRIIGNHHAGGGNPRPVDILKGVNMSFRTDRIGGLRFDEELRGSGAQVGVELGFCLALRRRGATLLYDPAITVNHDPAPRADADDRDRFVVESFADAVTNVTYLTLLHLPPMRRRVFRLYSMLVGTQGEPGLVQWIRLSLRGDPDASRKWMAARRGRRAGRALFRMVRRQLNGSARTPPDRAVPPDA